MAVDGVDDWIVCNQFHLYFAHTILYSYFIGIIFCMPVDLILHVPFLEYLNICFKNVDRPDPIFIWPLNETHYLMSTVGLWRWS